MRFFYTFPLLFLSWSLAQAQPGKFTQLSQFMDSLEVKEKFMGTLLIAENGEPVFQRSVGFADISTNKPIEIDSKLRIGSVSKMFTTVLVFQAIEAGKLSLDQKLSDFFPLIQNSGKISISHLLHHRSGIFNFTSRIDYEIYRINPHSEDQLLSMMTEGGSVFEPDSKAEYSNSNFVLLTFILEKVNNKPYQTLLQDQILKPLKMNNTYVFGPVSIGSGEAKSYLYNGQWVEDKETHPTVPLGAGAITSTATDLHTFATALFGGKLISSMNLDLMMEIRDGYGRGMFLFPYYDRESYGHTGGIDGFRSFLGHFPEDNVTLVLLSNGMNYNSNDILLAALNSNFGKEWKMPDFSELVISEELLAKYSGTYVSSQIPLQLTVENKSGRVAIQLTGQPQAVLQATAEHTFELKAVSATFIFDPDQNQVTLKQGLANILFKKK